MDKQIIDKINQDLLARRTEITRELSEYTNNVDEHHTKFPNIGDSMEENAQEVSEYETNLATEKILEEELRDITAALERMEKGEYGVCKYCGNEIGEKRLLARPVASSCIECKNKLQKGLL